ncbi:MFS transporter, partial [Akkermansiaceae bacterium]|nr:MFS transporter [Akkermansiaceae bacterium]
MMFLQFFVWGAWFVTLFLVLGGNGLEDVIADAYSTAPIAAIIAPLFLGLIADRFFSSEKVMGVLMLVGGVLMLLVPGAVGNGNGSLVFWLFMGHMLCYMPTLGLGNTIAFTHLPRDVFPKVRVWGTVGWIVAGLVTGYLGWSASTNLFWMAGISSVALGAFCFCLPNTPPPSAGQPVNVRALFMVDAFKMFAIPAFAVFMICSTLICIPLAYYYSNASPFLANMGFEQPASAMSIGQMSEIFFMLLIPFFFRKLGVKWMIMIGMMAWVLRYILFALGAPDQVAWMLFAGIALPVFLSAHLGWDFTAIGSFMAIWVIGYGIVQASAPAITKKKGDVGSTAATTLAWGIALSVVTIAIAVGVQFEWNLTKTVLGGLILFGIVFAMNSALHSYLILAYSNTDKA